MDVVGNIIIDYRLAEMAIDGGESDLPDLDAKMAEFDSIMRSFASNGHLRVIDSIMTVLPQVDEQAVALDAIVVPPGVNMDEDKIGKMMAVVGKVREISIRIKRLAASIPKDSAAHRAMELIQDRICIFDAKAMARFDPATG